MKDVLGDENDFQRCLLNHVLYSELKLLINNKMLHFIIFTIKLIDLMTSNSLPATRPAHVGFHLKRNSFFSSFLMLYAPLQYR